MSLTMTTKYKRPYNDENNFNAFILFVLFVLLCFLPVCNQSINCLLSLLMPIFNAELYFKNSNK